MVYELFHPDGKNFAVLYCSESGCHEFVKWAKLHRIVVSEPFSSVWNGTWAVCIEYRNKKELMLIKLTWLGVENNDTND